AKQVSITTHPLNTKKKAVPSDRDGIDGGSSSIEIILDWLTTGSNYPRWRGNLEEGKTKKSLCAEMIQRMKQNGIIHRDTKVKSNFIVLFLIWFYVISDLQSSYNTSRDLIGNKGTGILESEASNGVKTVDEQVDLLCRYWDLLDPMMGSSANQRQTCR
ncbi:hypothetical protein VP01_9070g1, partial [Puccinia sorghi]